MPFATYLTQIFLHSDVVFSTTPVTKPPFDQTFSLQKARVVFLEDQQGLVIAIIPGDFRFQLSRLKSLLQRPGLRFPVISASSLVIELHNAESGAAAGSHFQLIIDESINHQQQLALSLSGYPDYLVVSVWDMIMQIEGAILGGLFSISSKRPVALSADYSL